MYLKSVDGSFPCQPISFHCSDIKPESSSPGKAASHSALKASYNNRANIKLERKAVIKVSFNPNQMDCLQFEGSN